MLSVFDIDHDKIGWLHLKRLNVWIAKQVDEKCGCYGVNLGKLGPSAATRRLEQSTGSSQLTNNWFIYTKQSAT